MSRARTASFLLAFASLGSLILAIPTHRTHAALAAALALAVSSVSWVLLGPWERRRRIAALGETYAVVLGMTAGGVTRRAYVRGMESAGGDEGAVAA